MSKGYKILCFGLFLLFLACMLTIVYGDDVFMFPTIMLLIADVFFGFSVSFIGIVEIGSESNKRYYANLIRENDDYYDSMQRKSKIQFDERLRQLNLEGEKK